MLFKRREEEPLLTKARVHLWPRRSWTRSTLYVTHRLKRLSASPHAIALGFAIGCFIATTPLLGCHVILSALVAWAMGGSIVASFFGTFVGNPVTYPIAWYASYKVGTVLLGLPPNHLHADFSRNLFSASWEQIWPIFKPTLLGSIPIGLLVAAIAYFLMKTAVQVYQERRRRRFALRRPQGEIVSAP
ncbi:DUF2062 domain-containing protein [Methyloligella sp. 2.7D]|uniref:DUF2062 domain-containing protein n=1 Tax=unclassified Methyloligella TaxID=2625955 RepID=UPI00157BFB35|nr:DUF2062 domain-containing protein [Methyloligella sp. GL2]QKP77615.1 DUF2062 domain-containing protein [Methyloligella sp. GL2]